MGDGSFLVARCERPSSGMEVSGDTGGGDVDPVGPSVKYEPLRRRRRCDALNKVASCCLQLIAGAERCNDDAVGCKRAVRPCHVRISVSRAQPRVCDDDHTGLDARAQLARPPVLACASWARAADPCGQYHTPAAAHGLC